MTYRHILMERVTRIELAYSAWKADVLPLNYTRKWSGKQDSNLRHLGPKPSALPSWAISRNDFFYMARQTGLEPVAFWSVAKRSIQLSYWRKTWMAVSTGLEPAISSVTDWHVNHYTTRPFHNALLLYHYFHNKSRFYYFYFNDIKKIIIHISRELLLFNYRTDKI